MSALLLSPHPDDETLFAAYTCLRWRPHVIICIAPGESREHETAGAMDVLGCSWEQWKITSSQLSLAHLTALLIEEDEAGQIERVFAPAVEEDGHEEHTLVGLAAHHVFRDRVTSYLTYRRGHGRSRSAEVVMFEKEWPGLKLAAMACYQSQVTYGPTRPWFDNWIDEWYA